MARKAQSKIVSTSEVHEAPVAQEVTASAAPDHGQIEKPAAEMEVPKDETITQANFLDKVKKFKKEETSSEKKEAVEAEAPAAEEKEVEGAPVEEEEEEEEAVATADEGDSSGEEWKPREKFVAAGKEYDVPTWAKKAASTPEEEKEIIEVLEKSRGLEHVKARAQELHAQYQEMQVEHSGLMKDINRIKQIYNDSLSSGNLLALREMWDELQIPDEVVLNYALARAKLSQLPPEQRQAYDTQVHQQRELRNTRAQSEQTITQAQQLAAQARVQMLDMLLERQDIVPVVQAYESRPGRKSGSFREQVIRTAMLEWQASQRDLTPQEAIKETIANLGLDLDPAPQAQQTKSTPAAPAPGSEKAPAVVAKHRNVPVIPGVGSTGGSPLKSPVRSLDDLRKRADGMRN